MKKQEKIIALRTAAKLKVAEIETQIAVARSETSEKRARLLCDRAADLEGLEAGSTERFDVLAKYRSLLSLIEAHLSATVAECKLEIQQTKAECEKLCAAAEDDPEPETDNDVTVKDFQPQETVYCDGSEHSARIVARRLINKMPHIPKDGFLFMHIIRDDNGDFFVSISARGKSTNGDVSKIFSKNTHTAESETDFIEEAREILNTEEGKDNSNSHVAEPLSRALDAVFGGNPVEQVENLISDTVKSGKEGGNE